MIWSTWRQFHLKQYSGYSLENCTTIGLKSNAISLQNEKQRLNQLPEGKSNQHNEVFTYVNAAKEQSRRAAAQIFYNYQQLLHKQHCVTRSPGVYHICAQQLQLLPKSDNEHVHTLQKARCLLCLLKPNMMLCERGRNVGLYAKGCLQIVICAIFSISLFSCQIHVLQ